jgi:hypothetical protein
MAFDTFDARQKAVAEKALSLCRKRYGANGLHIEEAISQELGWRPTFFLRPAKALILAVEVDDNLFPEALKVAAYEVAKFDQPIAVYQACSLTAYQADPKQGKINLLRKNGFGIITVDDDGNAVIQQPGIPLAQHISDEELEGALSELTPGLRVDFKRAHDTYLANPGQGVQQVGQIVEALIGCIAKQAVKKGVITPAEAKGDLADVIDALYQKPTFRNHRAALGAARDFIKEYRNIASHPQKTAAQAMEKIRRCKDGFLRGVGVATKIRLAMQQLHYVIKINVA